MLIELTVLPNGEGLPLPKHATELSAGVDLYAAEEVMLRKNSRLVIPTGIAIAIPKGFEGQVRSRSGLAAKQGIAVLNSPGTIDADYRGEIKVTLINTSKFPYIVKRGDRIAQLIIARHERIEWGVVTELSSTERGSKGIGSTGQ
jgi:dUTP pyrophosphatase